MTEYINTGLLAGKPESPKSAWILEEKPKEEQAGQAKTSSTKTSSNPKQPNE
jgi:hypothetical protein